MGMINKLAAPAYMFPAHRGSDSLDVAMKALYEIARFPNSVARIGMTGPEVASYVQVLARRAIAHIENTDKDAV